ncbi:MAG TPA: hypothetical protein VM554_06280 [Acidisarcina sp.]|nr:hypothetical protein [Acidisarcina sp.]
MPKQIEARLPRSAKEFPWTRTVAVGSLIAGVCLLLGGKRKAGVGLAAAGTIIALAEEPEVIKEWWEGIPGYVKTGQNLLQKIEGFVEQLAEQGESVRRMVRR